MTPAMQAAAQGAAGPNGSMLGCFTLVKKQGAAAGTATATGRVGRSRAATAAGRAAAAAGDGQDTAIVIMTDGESAAKYAFWIIALFTYTTVCGAYWCCPTICQYDMSMPCAVAQPSLGISANEK